MSRNKRLFLFAGYDQDCIIDDALIYYVKTLSKYGAVILCMDCDCQRKELDKIKKYTIHIMAKRHREYDFGSYKRCFQYAHNKDLLKDYDYLYLVNDSVFGPTTNIEQTLKNIEKIPTDTAGLIISKHRTHEFMESWFVRINKEIFMSKWFYDFMGSVKKEDNKSDITIKYEHGLTNLIHNKHCSWGGLCTVRGRTTYNKPIYLFYRNIPFIKKTSFTRHNGACGNQIKYILTHCETPARNAIIKTANRLYGIKYMDWLLTSNPIKIFIRKAKYLKQKIWNKK